jgi:hypothetical protein
MRRAEINDSPVMRFIEEEEAAGSSYFPLRAKKISSFMEDEEEEVKFGLPRPDMTKINATPQKKLRAINPYEE